jgi:hypothetical protein
MHADIGAVSPGNNPLPLEMGCIRGAAEFARGELALTQGNSCSPADAPVPTKLARPGSKTLQSAICKEEETRSELLAAAMAIRNR